MRKGSRYDLSWVGKLRLPFISTYAQPQVGHGAEMSDQLLSNFYQQKSNLRASSSDQA